MAFRDLDPTNSNLSGFDFDSKNGSESNPSEDLGTFDFDPALEFDRFDLEPEEITYLSFRSDESVDQLHRNLEAYLHPGSVPRSTQPTWALTQLDANRANLIINDPIEPPDSKLLTGQLVGQRGERLTVEITTNNKDIDVVWEAIAAEFNLSYWRVLNLQRPSTPNVRKKRR